MPKIDSSNVGLTLWTEECASDGDRSEDAVVAETGVTFVEASVAVDEA